MTQQTRASKLEILCACDQNCTFAIEIYKLREALQEIVNLSKGYGLTFVGEGYVKCGAIAQKALDAPADGEIGDGK